MTKSSFSSRRILLVVTTMMLIGCFSTTTTTFRLLSSSSVLCRALTFTPTYNVKTTSSRTTFVQRRRTIGNISKETKNTTTPPPISTTSRTSSLTNWHSSSILLRMSSTSIDNNNGSSGVEDSTTTTTTATTEFMEEQDQEGYYSSEEDDDDDENDDDELEEEENENDNTNQPSPEQQQQEPSPKRQLYNQIQTSIKQTIQTLTKKQTSLQRELNKVKSLESTLHRANLIISNLYQITPQLQQSNNKIMVHDWDNNGMEVELILDTETYNTPQEEADALFDKARKMKRGSVIVEELYSKVSDGLEILNEVIMDLNVIVVDDNDSSSDGDEKMDEGYLIMLLERLERTSSKTGFQLIEQQQQQPQKRQQSNNPKNKNKKKKKREPTFRRFKTKNGCIILVGRNRRDNEAICFQVSKPNDIWMHSRGCPGAHVLLQIRRSSPQPTTECYQYAANLAAFYSDARTEHKAPITTAYAKHILKPRGAPLGAVKCRIENASMIGFPNDVDEELKIARERSSGQVGGWGDEGGSRSLGGKARNKKKTREVSKQMMEKKKAEKKNKGKRGRNSVDDAEEFY